MRYFLAHPFLAQIAQISTKQVGYFRAICNYLTQKIIPQIHANWAIFSKGKGERGKKEGEVRSYSSNSPWIQTAQGLFH
jgi:hypothetical protein